MMPPSLSSCSIKGLSFEVFVHSSALVGGLVEGPFFLALYAADFTDVSDGIESRDIPDKRAFSLSSLGKNEQREQRASI